MTPDELKVAIEQTKDKIWELRSWLETASSPEEKRRLKRQLKELQYLQLWHLDKLG